jgi:hypothetical protein
MVAKFMKYIKAGAARTRAAVEMVISDSHFPHAHMQVETYLKKYGDKAEMARVSRGHNGCCIFAFSPLTLVSVAAFTITNLLYALLHSFAGLGVRAD